MSRSRSQDGFTLIELLVVVAIVGILAAVALPAFLGQTRGANDAKAKADVANAEDAIESYWSAHDTYNATRAELVAIEGALSQAINLTVSGTDQTFLISAESKRGSTFYIEKSPAGVERRCIPVGIGGCDGTGHW
jgi:prepilin-type N-terminal cleavage/methylation domain-containing protein